MAQLALLRIYDIGILITKVIDKTGGVGGLSLSSRHVRSITNLRHVGREGRMFHLYHTHSHAFVYVLKVLNFKFDLAQPKRTGLASHPCDPSRGRWVR